MREGKSLTDLAQEIERQAASKKDFIADTRHLGFATDERGTSRITVPSGEDSKERFPITAHTHSQLAARVKIPKAYYDRMRNEAPDLLDANVNGWFQKAPERRMVRTLDGDARAFLSDRYRRIDNYDIFKVTLPILQSAGDLTVRSCEVTPSKMYIKATFPNVSRELKVGDTVESGIAISNSEIGKGMVDVASLVYNLVCLNGMTLPSNLKRRHVGASVVGDGVLEDDSVFSDETLAQDDKTLLMKIQDLVKSALDEARFAEAIRKMDEASEQAITGSPVKAVEVLANRFNLNGEEQEGVLLRLIEGKDLTHFGVVQAITRHAQDVEDYDRASEMEALGGTVLNLAGSEWNEIGIAA